MSIIGWNGGIVVRSTCFLIKHTLVLVWYILLYFAIFENCLLVILERELGEGRFSLKLGSRLV